MKQSIAPRVFLSWPLAALFILALGIFPAGCGDDETAPETTADDTEKSLDELSGFGQDALNQPGAQVLSDPAVSNILNVLPLSLPGFLSPSRTAPYRVAASPVPPVMGELLGRLTRPEGVPLEIVGFGTYHYDSTSTEGPFDGWVLDTAGVPDDGYIFKFTESDGFYYLDEDSNRVDIQGEIRVLDVTWSEGLAGPLDDVATHFILEIAAGTETPATPGDYPVLLHVEATLTLDANRQVATVRVGDRTANGSSDPDAAYLGHFLFALEIDITRDAGLANVHLLLQLYDSLADYVLRVETDVEGLNEETGTAVAITLGLGYGETTTPENPPWDYSVTLDNFRADPTNPEDDEDQIADVSGTISLNGDRVATIFGTTDDSVDLDGDEEPDCINTWVTFENDPGRPVSICILALALFQAFGEFLPTAAAPLVM